jgi:SAM-dependent methyltransferase
MPAPPACPVCGARDARELTRGHDYEYGSLPGPFTFWQCSGCGHGHLEPMPPPEELDVIYPPTYYTVNPRSPISFARSIYDTKMKRDVGRIAALASARRVRSVVDLGCGDAERLARVGERLGGGVEVIGVDLKPDAARAAALARRGVRMVQGNIEGGLDGLEDGAHDLILMCQILEHLYDPARALAGILRKLAPGGLLLVETPNIGGIDYHLFRGRYWGAYHIPRHFHLFTTGSLQRVLEEAGFVIEKRGFIPSGFLIVSLRNKLGLNSIERSDRFGEFLRMKSFPVVAAVAALDLAWMALGRQTSNQYVLAARPEDAA